MHIFFLFLHIFTNWPQAMSFISGFSGLDELGSLFGAIKTGNLGLLKG